MSKFEKLEFYRPRQKGYKLLPFRFSPLDGDTYVATNLAGEYAVLDREAVSRLVNHELRPDTPEYVELRARHFLVDDTTSVAPELLAIKLRTRYERLAEFTGLHIFVVTLRCEHSCPYCQVSRQSEDRQRYDMSEEVASKSIDLALSSPSRAIKIEFQGGESLLNLPRIKQIVHEAKEKNRLARKDLQFVVATNLALIDDDALRFFREHDVHISTSLDGPRDLHNKNRPRPGHDSYERTVSGIDRARHELGPDRVSALMTTTLASLSRVQDIIDEYATRDFEGIFLRPLSPYGFAVKTKSFQSYNADRWLQFYKEGLDYVLDLNRSGRSFVEYYTAVILRKMLTSEDPGYVDLMSPSGIGLGAVVYNYDGTVYASDEARMLAEMGIERFKLGDVRLNSASEIFFSDSLLDPIEGSFAYSAPMCNDCAFEPYCGADPVYHFATHGDFVGRKPTSDFCRRNMSIFKHLITLMERDPFARRLFTDWANQ